MAKVNNSLLEQGENFFQTYLYDKAPHLPPEWQDLLVKYLPYLNIILIILSLFPILLALGLGAMLSPFMFLAGGVGVYASFSFTIIVLIISVAMQILAIPGLFAKTSKAWYLLYYSALINAFYSLLMYNIFGFIIVGALSIYLLFQIKKHYTH